MPNYEINFSVGSHGNEERQRDKNTFIRFGLDCIELRDRNVYCTAEQRSSVTKLFVLKQHLRHRI